MFGSVAPVCIYSGNKLSWSEFFKLPAGNSCSWFSQLIVPWKKISFLCDFLVASYPLNEVMLEDCRGLRYSCDSCRTKEFSTFANSVYISSIISLRLYFFTEGVIYKYTTQAGYKLFCACLCETCCGRSHIFPVSISYPGSSIYFQLQFRSS